MMDYKALIFPDPEPFDGGEYCDFDTAAAITAGKDILLGVWNSDGSKLLAISGQQGLTINRSAETIEVNSKSTEGGWKDSLAGMKEWSIDNDGLWVASDDAHKALATAFKNGNPVCVKVYNGKTKKGAELSCGRTARSESRHSEKNLRVFRERKVSKGRRVIRRSHYTLRPGDTVVIGGEKHRAKGVHNKGTYVVTDAKKSVPVKKVEKIIHAGGYMPVK